jgi:hypothetical protein
MSIRRIERLERAAAGIDWRDHLPEGVTAAEAEAALELWARLAADYADNQGVSLAVAMEATRGPLGTLLESGSALEDDEEDDDHENGL